VEKIRKKNLNIDLGVLKFHDFVPHLSLARCLYSYDCVKFIDRKDSFFFPRMNWFIYSVPPDS